MAFNLEMQPVDLVGDGKDFFAGFDWPNGLAMLDVHGSLYPQRVGVIA